MTIDFPLHIDARGRTATTGSADHVRDLVEQVLFTSPGERVNRPDFGSGVMELVFGAGGAEIETAATFVVQGALQRWLGDLILVEDVRGEHDDGMLRVTVVYRLAGGDRRELQVERRV